MKVFKTLRIIGIVILVVILGLVVAFHFFGGKAMKAGVEAGATQALKVPVAVEEVNLSILAGQAGVKNLIVDNPAGYQNEKMLEVGEAKVDLAVLSVLSDTVRIEDIFLEKVSVVLEQKGLTNNIQEVLDGMSPKSAERESKEEVSEKPAKKLLVKKLEIREVAVKVKLLPIPGKKDTLTMKLSPITMTDLGSDDTLDIAMLSSKILLAIVEGIAKQGVGILPDEIIGPMGDKLKGLGAAAEAVLGGTGEVLKEGQKATEKVLEETQKVGEDIKKGLGDLFKAKDKEEE
jgi:hypothetical protein